MPKKKKKTRKEKVTHSASWSELPTDLIEFILKKLPSIVDIIRFKLVCPLWNSAANSYISSPYYKPSPWLIFSIFQDHNESEIGRRRAATHVFDPLEEKLYKIKSVNDDSPYAEIVGSSSHGWLVIMDRAHSLPPLELFNPFSGAKIALPNLWNTTYEYCKRKCRYPFRNKKLVNPFSEAKIALPNLSNTSYELCKPKASISSNPLRNKNALVAVLIWGSILFCKQEDEAWTTLAEGEIHGYGDIVFHNNQLFGLLRLADGSLDVWDCTESVPVKTMFIRSSETVTEMQPTLLVPSLMGDILRVRRFDNEYPSPPRTQFTVEKLNMTLKQWESVKSLGNQVLHFNHNHLTSSFSEKQWTSLSANLQSILGCKNTISFPDGEMNVTYCLDRKRVISRWRVNLSEIDRCIYPENSYHVVFEPFVIVPTPF